MITAYWPKRAQTSSEGLKKLRENPELLEAPAPNLAPRKFSVKLAEHVGAKFSGRRTFIEAVEECVPHFYREVGQRLRAWVPTPPKSPPEPKSNSSDTPTSGTSKPNPPSTTNASTAGMEDINSGG